MSRVDRVDRTWRLTPALARALVVGTLGLVGAVALGRPVLVVLVVPLLACAAPALAGRPGAAPRVSSRPGSTSLVEGQATSSRLHVEGVEEAEGVEGVEVVTRVLLPRSHQRARPDQGRVVALAARRGPVAPDLEIGVDRWGSHDVGAERVVLTSAWGGWRWGPVDLGGRLVPVLPSTAGRPSGAEQPMPRGLVGLHRSAREGTGTELSGIRPFAPGDRLRRINWRVSARTGDLHVTTTRAEEDAGLLLVLDLLVEHGRSEGLRGRASSLDLTVRAAATLAEEACRRGDRVALRPVGGRTRAVPFGAGPRHLQRVLRTLADVSVAGSVYDEPRRLDLHAGAGTTVVLLSPLLVEVMATVAATAARHGHPTLVVDTLPTDAGHGLVDVDEREADLAWRMRLLERDSVRGALAATGCPVVAWSGAGTLEEVLRRLAQRSRAPRLTAR